MLFDQLIYIPLPDQASRLSILKAILRKTPIDPQIPLDFVAKLIEGFSGADIKELCNQVCKSAIKESIEFDESKKALMKERPGEDVQMSDDPVPMLTKRHFEFGLAHSAKSVHDVDQQRYEDFSMIQTFHLRRKERNNLTRLHGMVQEYLKANLNKEEMTI